MAIYRFKISFEEAEEVARIIEIRSSQTFADFHFAIQQAIRFDNSKPTSFYMSDDHWRKGKEISFARLGDSKLADFIEDPHQKMLYLFDFDAQWIFNIELQKIVVEEDLTASYPLCIKSTGTAPRQYKPTTLPPVVDDDEEDEIPVDKIFQHEEGLD